ncbi:hypothetical protein Barb6_02990 [Bacteroidales bacterium Barb6]|nr:hypothetical protein Barb6_02990 [Bacteroidales bacterium Barb6]
MVTKHPLRTKTSNNLGIAVISFDFSLDLT